MKEITAGNKQGKKEKIYVEKVADFMFNIYEKFEWITPDMLFLSFITIYSIASIILFIFAIIRRF